MNITLYEDDLSDSAKSYYEEDGDWDFLTLHNFQRQLAVCLDLADRVTFFSNDGIVKLLKTRLKKRGK